MKSLVKHVVLLQNIEGVVTTEKHIRDHVKFLRELDKNGKLVMCGPFTNYKGGMIVLNVENIEEANIIAKSDPFVQNNVRTFEVRTWAISCEENNHLGMG